MNELCDHKAFVGNVDGVYKCSLCGATLVRTEEECPDCKGTGTMESGSGMVDDPLEVTTCQDCDGDGIVVTFSGEGEAQ